MTQGAGLWAKGKRVLKEPPSSHLGSDLPCMDSCSLMVLLCELLGGTCPHHSTVPMSLLWRLIKGQIHAAVHVSGVLGVCHPAAYPRDRQNPGAAVLIEAESLSSPVGGP